MSISEMLYQSWEMDRITRLQQVNSVTVGNIKKEIKG